MATTEQTSLDTENRSLDEIISSPDDPDKEKCPTCGKVFKKITSHWSQSDCPYPEPSDEKMGIFKGFMCGDGCLNRQTTKHPYLTIRSTTLPFLHYVNEKLGWVSNSLLLERTAEEQAELGNKQGGRWGGNVTAEDRKAVYYLQTKTLPVLKCFHSWWETGECVFPEDLSLMEEGLKMWYCSDGNLNWKWKKYSRVAFTSANESDRPESIIHAIEEHGFDVNHAGEQFYIPSAQTENFLSYIGGPPPGLEYKWCVKDYERYKELIEYNRNADWSYLPEHLRSIE